MNLKLILLVATVELSWILNASVTLNIEWTGSAWFIDNKYKK